MRTVFAETTSALLTEDPLTAVVHAAGILREHGSETFAALSETSGVVTKTPR